MELFKWYKQYSVNNDTLDEHHQTLFRIMNKLYANSIDNESTYSLEPIIKELESYTNYHFSAEEQHMRETGYKDLDSHIAEHKAFTQRALQLRQTVNKDDFEVAKELIVFLGNWLLKHVLEEDRKYSV